MIKLAKLNPRENNPRTISEEAMQKLCDSIKRDPDFMKLRPIVYDPDNGNEILGGNMRYRACVLLGMEEIPNDWTKSASGLTEEQKRRFVIVDNAPSGMAGRWDWDLLANEFDVEELTDWGFSEAELGMMEPEEPAIGNKSAPDAKMNQKKELAEKWKTAIGQQWQLGDHILICADSADVMGSGDQCKTLFFDPEWDAIPEIPKYENTLAFTDGQHFSEINRQFGAPTWCFTWDCGACWYVPNQPLRRAKYCMWFGNLADYEYNGSHYGEPDAPHVVSNSRGKYMYEPDPRGKHLADVYSESLVALHKDGLHSHEKPVDWVRMLIANCTTGDVFDPFAGAGTCLIACQQLGRKCVSVEIDRENVAVILERWQEMTGQEPKCTDNKIKKIISVRDSIKTETELKEQSSDTAFRKMAMRYQAFEMCAISSAEELIEKELKQNTQIRAITKKWFNALSVIKALGKKFELTEVFICIYRMNQASAAALLEFAEASKTEITIILNRWFRTPKNYQKWCRLMVESAKNIKNLKVGFAPTHAKIAIMKTKCGKHIVFEGSGNMADNDRIEQYLLENNKQTYEFHKKWITEEFEENAE